MRNSEQVDAGSAKFKLSFLFCGYPIIHLNAHPEAGLHI